MASSIPHPRSRLTAQRPSVHSLTQAQDVGLRRGCFLAFHCYVHQREPRAMVQQDVAISDEVFREPLRSGPARDRRQLVLNAAGQRSTMVLESWVGLPCPAIAPG